MRTYFWNAEKLAEDLRRGVTTEVEKMRYLLIFTLVHVVASYMTLFAGEPTLIYTLDWLAFLVITILGIFYCFRQNAKGDNTDFIVRFVCLSLPTTVRILVFSIPVVIVFYEVLFFGLLTEEQVLSYGPIAEALFFNVLGIAFYYLLGSYITLAARPDSSS